MDALDRAANLEDCAIRWRLDARWFSGRCKEWRLKRADELEKLAWDIINKNI